MTTISIQEAGSKFSKLIEMAAKGEEVILTEAGKPLAKLLPYRPTLEGKRQGGQWKGKVYIADDFDTLSSDILAEFHKSL